MLINNLLLAFRDSGRPLLRNRSYNYPKPVKTQGITLFALPQYFIVLTLERHGCCFFVSKSLFLVTLRILNELCVLLHNFLALRTFFGTLQVNGGNREP